MKHARFASGEAVANASPEPREDVNVKSSLLLNLVAGAAAVTLFAFALPAQAAPEIVTGPSDDAACYVPWADDTQFLKYEAKSGPFRVALAR
jgi:ribose transport system substrate-binding protein